MLDPVNYWAQASGLGSENEKSVPYSNFVSNAARNYSNFGSSPAFGGFEFNSNAGFKSNDSGTRSFLSDFLDRERYETDLASGALGAITNLALAKMAPKQGSSGGGGGGGGFGGDLVKTVVGAGVGAGVSALI
ncbi:MAG TPA: hypothetical protein DEP13_08125 [Gammaproteobacteria bacterium]|nr:hypothetical protein [Gammaproteobacteria bacterium]